MTKLIPCLALVLTLSTAFAADTIPLKAAPATSEPAPVPKDAAPQKPYVASAEVFGTSRLTESQLKALLGPALDEWLQAGLSGSPKAPAMERALAEKVKNKFGFADAQWSVVQYFEPGGFPLHATLDVVEKEDVAKRMPFLTKPTETLADPGGLLKKWEEYQTLALSMVQKGELQPEVDSCPAFHCPFGHQNPKLKPFEKIFVDGVKKHGNALLLTQQKDKDAVNRAFATYLLAYWKENGKKVVDQLVERIKDPDALVRNNALRVLGDIAEFHKELPIPHRPVIEALQFPRVSDRSKAVYLLYQQALNSAAVREDVLKYAVPSLLKLLASHQPDQRELSHSVLKKVSNKEFGPGDLAAWNRWWMKASQDAIAKKP